jgi:hypothetical protein
VCVATAAMALLYALWRLVLYHCSFKHLRLQPTVLDDLEALAYIEVPFR